MKSLPVNNMKTFGQIRRGDKIYTYSEEGNMSFEMIVERIDSNPLYINGCRLDRNKSIDDYSENHYEGRRDFYATDRNLLKPIIVENIKRILEDKIAHKEMLENEISNIKKELMSFD